MTKTVLILGASGKIGRHAAQAFAKAGWIIRKFDRKTGDMTRDAMGCDLIVNGMNPPNYHNWAEIIPQITDQVIKAARASGARVLIPGNVYVYGDTPGTWGPDTPQTPCSRKGQIRKEMEARYRDAGIPVLILRAGNFIDPEQGEDVLSIMITGKVAKGKIGFPGSPDVMQPWCYLPDWARAAVALVEREDQLATFEDVPFPGHEVTLNGWKAAVEAQTGQSLRVTHFPWGVMRVAGPVWELARELGEMRYLWETAHRLDGARLAALVPEFEATPLDEVVRAVVPSAQKVAA